MSRRRVGPRRFVATRLPVDVFARFDKAAAAAGLTWSDFAAVAILNEVQRAEQRAHEMAAVSH